MPTVARGRSANARAAKERKRSAAGRQLAPAATASAKETSAPAAAAPTQAKTPAVSEIAAVPATARRTRPTNQPRRPTGPENNVSTRPSDSSCRAAPTCAHMNRQTTRTKNRNAHLLVRVELETLHQPVSVGDVRAAVQAGEELERLRRGHRRPQRRLTRHVGDAAVGGRRVAPGVDPEE